jgi:hypothetical protein
MDYLSIAKEIVLKHIGVMGTKPLDPRTIFEMEHELEESLVPYKVDIVDFFYVDEAFKNMALKKIIEWS